MKRISRKSNKLLIFFLCMSRLIASLFIFQHPTDPRLIHFSMHWIDTELPILNLQSATSVLFSLSLLLYIFPLPSLQCIFNALCLQIRSSYLKSVSFLLSDTDLSLGPDNLRDRKESEASQIPYLILDSTSRTNANVLHRLTRSLR